MHAPSVANFADADDTRKRASGRLIDALVLVDDLKQLFLMSVLLQSGRAQAGKTIFIDRGLPGKKLFRRQRIALTGLF
jgi:hypothetical protein